MASKVDFSRFDATENFDELTIKALNRSSPPKLYKLHLREHGKYEKWTFRDFKFICHFFMIALLHFKFCTFFYN